MKNFTDSSQVQWIWSDNNSNTPADSYQRFRGSFNWDSTTDSRVTAAIAADSTWVLFVNGKRIPGGQYSDFPDQRSFSVFDITSFLVQGSNTIAVSVHYIGAELLLYLPGTPHLRMAVENAAGKLLCATDQTWKCSADPAFSARQKYMTPQAGFIFEYDARHAENWQAPDFDDSAWDNATEINGEHLSLENRPLPQLEEKMPAGAILQNCGILFRPPVRDDTPGCCCSSDFFKPEIPAKFFGKTGRFWRHRFPFDSNEYHQITLPEGEFANGCFLTFDLGQEECGYLRFKIRSSAGTVIDIAHGEHLEDGRVRVSNTSGRYNFADRYICREGENEFAYFHRRFGCRYIELHITGTGKEFAINSIGLIPLQLPLDNEAGFRCADHELLHLNRLSRRTLLLCMHEHYEDCPWREQALWNYDARLQMLHGYHLWGNYDFAAQSLELMRRSCRDGFLTLTEPGKSGTTIPMFTLAYIPALLDRLLYGGYWQQLDAHIGCAGNILDNALKNQRDGLFFLDDDSRYWNFYEWRGELERLNKHPQLPWNIYLCEAFRAFALLNKFCKDPATGEKFSELADTLGKNLEKFFRDGEIYSILAPGEAENSYKLPQYLMLANDLVPDERKKALFDALEHGELQETTSANFYFVMEAAMALDQNSRAKFHQLLMEEYRPMIYNGATSLWETRTGAADMNGSGSLCHGWSANSLTFCGRYLLGVKPLAPGFAEFRVKIYPAHLDRASGSIPTPHGMIEVSWRRHRDSSLSVEVSCPENCKMQIAEYPEYPVREWSLKQNPERINYE